MILTIELSEKQISGRTISLKVKYSDVLSADAFSWSLKWWFDHAVAIPRQRIIVTLNQRRSMEESKDLQSIYKIFRTIAVR